MMAKMPQLPSITNSVTHVICSPQVCGIHGNACSAVTICRILKPTTHMIDGGLNVCITGDLGSLLDVVDIKPVTILVALEGSPTSYDDCITKCGLLPLLLSDGTTYYQTCFYCLNMVETILSPAAVLASSNVFYSWNQEGFKYPLLPGSICFTSHDGLLSMFFPLTCHGGLYYCNTDVYAVDCNPVRVQCNRTATNPSFTPHHPASKFPPTTKARQVESKVWALHFGSPGEGQLDLLPQHIKGMPPVFEYHPFWFIDFKEQAYIHRQPAKRMAKWIPGCGSEFFMNFGFMWASTEDYKRPNTATNRIVCLYDGYCAYLLIVDGESRRVWVFLTTNKEPPIAILHTFMRKFGIAKGIVRTDQGGKLARSDEFCLMMAKEFTYLVEPTGANSALQNRGAKIYNNTLAVKVRTLLYGSGLPTKFWSAALLHAVYLHNCLVHSATSKTPFEGWFGQKPNVAYLKTFGSRVCVKCTSSQCCKLDLHDFTGIFLGYTATDQNIT
jgi:hypothetical protein